MHPYLSVIAASRRRISGISEFAYVTSYSSASNLTTYTFNACDFGAEDANRQIIIVVSHRNTAGISVASATIGGVTATIDIQNTGQEAAAIIRATVPTGSTGTVVVALSALSLRMGVAIYRVVAPSLTAGNTSAFASGTSQTITVPNNSAIISGGTALSGGGSWTGLTADASYAVEGSVYQVSASSGIISSGGSQTFNHTPTSSGGLVRASYS